MRTSLLLVLMAWLPAAQGAETDAPSRYSGSGYVAMGVGGCIHNVANVSVVGGGDAFVFRGLALGGEIGYYQFVENRGAGFGVTALNVGYHFVNRQRPGRVEPFVSAGVLGAAFRGSAVAAGSVGGGINYWFSRKAGLRLEGRAYGFGEGEGLFKFHIGLSFR